MSAVSLAEHISPPIIGLPLDICRTILHATFAFSMYDWMKAADWRTVLCVVSRTWLTAIYAWPEFWATTVITRTMSADYMAWVLAKTSGHKLTILILTKSFTLDKRPLGYGSYMVFCSMRQFIRGTLRELDGFYGQIVNITFDCQMPNDWREIWRELSHREWTCLKRLSLTLPISSNEGSLPPMTVDAPVSFTHNPNLSELRLSGYGALPVDMGLCSSLSSLRLCHLRGRCRVDCRTFHKVLVASPRLVLLQIANVEWIISNAPPNHISLPRLRDLHVTYCDSSVLKPLEPLHLPQLSLVHVHAHTDNLIDFSRTFAPCLETVCFVKLRTNVFNAMDLEHFICLMPRLHDLDICRTSPETFRLIAGLFRSSQALPALESLVVACPMDRGAAEELFSGVERIPTLVTLTVKTSSRSNLATVWRKADGNVTCSVDSLQYVGHSIAHQWAKLEKRYVCIS
ncbi:hypothetical protein K438DRAFT_1964322 [Mycena galopus ATCC 62051]|nr:hypothetical protein K438DRAFT_1964322 [Mycena galopus ATCC 62051]